MVGATVADGLGLAEADALTVAEAVIVGVTEREADAAAVLAEGRASDWGPHALTATMPRARASAP